MADHGEAFGVHTSPASRRSSTATTLYNELLHVPLMFRVPGATPCMRDDVVQLIDLAPTIAALFGVTPPRRWQGRSLVPALAWQAAARRSPRSPSCCRRRSGTTRRSR